MGEPRGAAAGEERALPPLPPAVHARLAGYAEQELRRGGRGLLIARLLEEGERDELRWLLAALGRATLAEWLRGHGGALLSRRSRAFWASVLAVQTPAARPLANELWPLA
jgi:hypothetical protein